MNWRPDSKLVGDAIARGRVVAPAECWHVIFHSDGDEAHAQGIEAARLAARTLLEDNDNSGSCEIMRAGRPIEKWHWYAGGYMGVGALTA